MSELVATIIGGAIALAGSIGSTVFVQSRVPVAERRNRAQRAADELIVELTELRNLEPEPESADEDAGRDWQKRRQMLLARVDVQALLLPLPELRNRVAFVAEGMSDPRTLKELGGLSEVWVRTELCRDGLECIGAFLRGEESLPSPRPMVGTVASVIAEYNEIMEEQAKEWEANRRRPRAPDGA